MAASVVYNSRANEDIQREWTFLFTSGGLRVADRFLLALEKTSLTLASFPFAGVACDFKTLRANNVRQFPVRAPYGNWIIYYQPAAAGILIHRVIHGALDRSDFIS